MHCNDFFLDCFARVEMKKSRNFKERLNKILENRSGLPFWILVGAVGFGFPMTFFLALIYPDKFFLRIFLTSVVGGVGFGIAFWTAFFYRR